MAPTRLAQYAQSSALSTHTITLDSAASGKSLFLVAASSAVMSLSSDSANWVEHVSYIDQNHRGIWRLPPAYTSGKTSITVTLSGAANMVAVVFEDNFQSSSSNHYFGVNINQTPGQYSAGIWGTNLHTFSGCTRSFAFFLADWTTSQTSDAAYDISSFDQSYTEFADTGLSQTASQEDLRIWLAERELGSMTSDGVTATLNSSWTAPSEWTRTGMFAYESFADTGTNYTKTISDNAGITDSRTASGTGGASITDTATVSDSVSVSFSRSKTIADSAGISDVASIPTKDLTVLARYAGAAGTSHTVPLSPSSSPGSTIWAVTVATAVISSPGTGWVKVHEYLNSQHYALWRLNAAQHTVALSSLSFTLSANRSMSAVVFQDDMNGSTLEIGALNTSNPTNINNYSTGSATFTEKDRVLAFFTLATPNTFWNNADFSSYSTGLTEIADSGTQANTDINNCRVWVAGKDNLAMSGAVTATFSPTYPNTGDMTGVVIGYDLNATVTTPTANAGPDQIVDTGVNVTLDGSASTPGAGTISSYNWTQTGGTTVTLSSATAQKPTFVAPSTPSVLSFQLTVTNSGGQTSFADAVTIDVRDPGAVPTIYQENQITTGVSTRTNWHDGVESAIALQSFPRRNYYAPGETAQFSVDFGTAFTAEVWRLGWYGAANNGARKVATVTTGTPTNQPAPNTIADSNGQIDCGNWSTNLQWQVPANATPGWYYVLLYDTATRTSFGWCLFCVTDTNAKNSVLVVSSDSTWAGAYNYYGGKGSAATTGKSLYGSGGPLGDASTRAYCVSLNRPVVTRIGVPQTHFFNSEYPFLRFIERYGFQVGYATNEQIDADPTVLDGRSLIIFNGHNEYISQPMMDKVFSLSKTTNTKFINLGGNDFFWRIRYGTATGAFDQATKGRVIWCRKDTLNGGTPIVDGDWGGTWQDTRWPYRQTATEIFSDRFTANGVRNDTIFVPSTFKGSPIWRNCTAVQNLAAGQSASLGTGTLGMEWDSHEAGGPAYTRLSSTDVSITAGVSDINGQDYSQSATLNHSLIIMKNRGGGYTFNASTTQWAWGLDDFHDRGTAVANPTVKQATINILYDFGAQGVSSLMSNDGLTVPTPVSNIQTAYGIPYDIYLSENVGATDSAGGALPLNKTQNESIGASDVLGVEKGVVSALSDTAGGTDSLTVVRDQSITIADNASATETMRFDRATTVPDSVGVTDNASKGQTGTGTASDSAGGADSVTYAFDAQRTVADSAGVTDSTSNFRGGVASDDDPAGITDSATFTQSFVRTISDSAGITDVAGGGAALSLSDSKSDTAGASDVAAAALGIDRGAADSAGVTDSVTANRDFSRTVNDTAGVTDNETGVLDTRDTAGVSDYTDAKNDFVRLTNESVGISDAVSYVRDFVANLTEGIDVTSPMSSSQSSSTNQNLNDSAGVSDSTAYAENFSRVLAENVGATDDEIASLGTSGAAGDSAGVSDSLSASLSYGRQISDGADATDVASKNIARPGGQDDGAAVGDSVTSSVGYARSIDDTAGISDSALPDTKTSTNESVGVTDSVTAVMGNINAYNDTGAVTDTVVVVVSRHVDIADAVAATDRPDNGAGLLIVVNDTVGASDAFSRVFDYASLVGDSVGVADNVSNGAAVGKRIYNRKGRLNIQNKKYEDAWVEDGRTSAKEKKK